MGSGKVRVQYSRTSRGDPPKHWLVFCLADSNGSPASKPMKTAFTFSSDGDSPSPSLDDQTATAIARFVQKKVDKGQLELPTESPTDPMEVEPQDPSGECFRLRLGQKKKEGNSLMWGGCFSCAATAPDCTSLFSSVSAVPPVDPTPVPETSQAARPRRSSTGMQRNMMDFTAKRGCRPLL